MNYKHIKFLVFGILALTSLKLAPLGLGFYGAFNDVTDIVNKTGFQNAVVGNKIFGPDPAPGIPKYLIVIPNWGAYKENQTIFPVQAKYAFYGALGEASDRLNYYIGKKIIVNNDFFGGDPAPGIKKQLVYIPFTTNQYGTTVLGNKQVTPENSSTIIPSS